MVLERNPITSPFEEGLERRDANHQPLTPIAFLERAAVVYADRPAVVHGASRLTYAQLWERCRRLASALARRGVGRGDVVSALLPNTPPMLEAHHGVPMAGAVLHSLNTRLDAAAVARQLDHAGSRVLLVDREFADLARAALALAEAAPLVVECDDPEHPEDAPHPKGAPLGGLDYEALLAEGDPSFEWVRPLDEWDAIALNYTSGTTGEPKGVVYHHRGAALMAYANTVHAGVAPGSAYLWTLPMFHCNGWCYPWTLALTGSTHVCLRWVRAGAIFDALADHGVTHLCGAPVVMAALIGASEAERRGFPQRVRFVTAAAPPPERVLQGMAEAGFDVVHVYGLTEVYGPAVVNVWREAWDALAPAERAARMARQGVRYAALDGLEVMDPVSMTPVPRDGETLGEVMMRGNIVMKGYLRNAQATREAFAGGWFRTGDLAVVHPDGWIQLKDRSKDIIISGGENISSIEVEDALYRHPDVAACAVVAKPDERWGETPCAFVEPRPGAALTEAEVIAHCRAHLAHFKCPRAIVFTEIPRTSTGKIEKYKLREAARAL